MIGLQAVVESTDNPRIWDAEVEDYKYVASLRYTVIC